MFDPAATKDWRLVARIDDAQLFGNGVEALSLKSGGRADGLSSTGFPDLSGKVDLTATGVTLQNIQIGQFLTGTVSAGTQFDLSEETGLALQNLFARSGVLRPQYESSLGKGRQCQ